MMAKSLGCRKALDVFVVLCYASTTISIATATFSPSTAYKKDGSVVLGGLFPLHYTAERPDNYSLLSEPMPLECKRYNFLGFRWMEAMIFAIEEINNSSEILPDLKLGWEVYDTCNTHARAVTQTLNMVHAFHDNCTKTDVAPVSAVVGPTSSDKSIVVSNILSVFDVTQISYASTSRLLSNKNIYSSFFRTIPNDDEQAVAIVDLLAHNNWTWVGAVAGDDDYGRPGIGRLKEEAAKKDICVEYTAYVSKSMSPSQLRQVAQEIRDFNATVFVLFISATHLVPLAEQLRILNVTGKVWIASEAWATSATVQQLPGADEIFKGTLGIATRGGPMPGFRTFLEGVSPQSQPSSPFIKEFWEQSFQCRCPESVCPHSEHESHSPETDVQCTGNEVLADAPVGSAYLGWEGDDLEKTYNVYLAVHVIAQALEQIIACKDGNGLLKDGKCPKIDSLQPWQLLAYMKNVDFVPPGQNLKSERFGMFTFDQNGDPNASYKLVSWRPTQKPSADQGNFQLVHVGNYSVITKPHWSIDEKQIYWANDLSEPPPSICNTPCQPGFYRLQLPSVCCFKCLECPSGEISMIEGSPSCIKCNATLMANNNRTKCIPRFESYVRWNDVFGIVFSCFSSLGILITLFICGAFIKKRETPLVKATNRQLSFFLLFAICCCFFTPFLYISKPRDWSCKARTILFSLSFTMCIAAILVKTLRVLTVFNAKIPVAYKKSAKWLGEHAQIFVVLAISVVQVALCVAWLIVDPPTARKVPKEGSFDTLTVECTMGSVPLVACVYGYLCLLALIAFVMAFRARKLPENFNEAKFVTFAMLIFFIVWLSFIPAYLTTSGTSSTAVYCIAILASTFGLLGCIFFHKLYVMFVTPSRNSIQEVRKNTAHHAMRSTRSVLYNVNATTTTVAESPVLGGTTDVNGLRATAGRPKQKAETRTSVSSVKRSQWRQRYLEQSRKEKQEVNLDVPKRDSPKSQRSSQGSRTSIHNINSESSANGSPAFNRGDRQSAGADGSSTTIQVGIEGHITNDSTSKLTKSVNCDESPSGSFEVKVDVKVNIHPTASRQSYSTDDPPPDYETSSTSTSRDCSLPLRSAPGSIENVSGESKRNSSAAVNRSHQEVKNKKSVTKSSPPVSATSLTSLLGDVTSTASSDSLSGSKGVEGVLITNGDSLTEASRA